MEYDVQEADSAEELREKVNAALADGWKLQGSVSVAICFGEWENERKGYQERKVFQHFAQALYKD